LIFDLKSCSGCSPYFSWQRALYGLVCIRVSLINVQHDRNLPLLGQKLGLWFFRQARLGLSTFPATPTLLPTVLVARSTLPSSSATISLSPVAVVYFFSIALRISVLTAGAGQG
jgi:hypothetical protein